MVADKNDLIVMVCLAALGITMMLASIIINDKIDTVITTSKEPTICIPLINESYQGDKYYVYCMNQKEYELEMEVLQHERMV